MAVEACAFRTDRLLVQPWHRWPVDQGPRPDLPGLVAGILTEPVTRHLPESWHGPYSIDRARVWIAERDAEGPTLLVVDRSNLQPVGLVMLFETPTENRQVEIRLGYLLAEEAQGKGLATELLRGLIEWCRSQPSIRSIVGGVAPENRPSRRVLERVGFASGSDDGSGAELEYQLVFERP